METDELEDLLLSIIADATKALQLGRAKRPPLPRHRRVDIVANSSYDVYLKKQEAEKQAAIDGGRGTAVGVDAGETVSRPDVGQKESST